MGGKNQTSTSTNTPTALPQLQDIWNRVQQVASTPYTPYSGQLVAGLTPTQQSGIDNTNAAVGTAQPYIDQATQYANSGASAIDPSQIARYSNPYTQSVINSTQAQFNNQNQQQSQQLKGNAIAAGAFGGDRAGVAQAELANQQQLAQAPVIAGLNNQNFTQALQAAQQDRAAQSQGAYALSNLGGQAQNAALQGAQAQLGAGAVQQGTQQNQLSADYNQYLQALAFPYQQAQFLQGALPALTAQGGQTVNTTPGPNPWVQAAGIGLSAASMFSDRRVKKNVIRIGETYDGQPIYRFEYKGSNTPQIGLMAQDVEKKTPGAVGESNGVKTVNYDLATSKAAKKGHFASGGVVNFMDTPTYIPIARAIQATSPYGSPAAQIAQPQQPQSFSPQLLSSAAKGGKSLLASLGFGGDTAGAPGYNTSPEMGGASVGFDANGGMFNFNGFGGGANRGGRIYADGGSVPFNFDDRWGDLPNGPPMQDDGAGSVESAMAFMGAPPSNPMATQAWRDSTDFAQGTPGATAGAPPMTAMTAPSVGLPPEITGGQSAPAGMPPDVVPAPMAYSQQQPDLITTPMSQTDQSSAMAAPSAPAGQMGGFNPFGLSDEARQGLISAGLGIAASKSPFALSAIGEGGLKGAETYTAAKKASSDKALAQSRIDQQAKQMAQQAEQFAKTLDLHQQTADETAKYHRGILDRENLKPVGTNEDGFPVYLDTKSGKEVIGETKIQGKAPSGYVRNVDGTMSAIKGGPADPDVVKGIASAKQGKPLEDSTADFLAERVINGDGKALVGLGRGSQGAENIARIQGLVAQKAKERGMDASDILAKTAEQSGLTAQQRTFGTQVARMAVNSTEAQGAIKLGREASANVPRGNWVPITKAIQAFQSGTSDPALAKFGAANLAIINTYARAISPTGQPTVNDKQHAEHLLSTATGPEAYNAILDQMNAEIDIAHAAPSKAKEEMERLRKIRPEAALPGAPPASAIQVGTEKQFKQGVGVWDGTKWVPKAQQ